MNVESAGRALGRILLAISVFGGVAHGLPADESLLPPLATQDGLELVLSDSGGVARVRLDDRDISDAKPHSGLWIVPYAGNPVPVTGQLTAENGSIRQQFKSDELGLRVEAVYRARGDRIQCTGSIADLTGKDRGVDLLFSLPIGRPDWRWGKDIREEVPLADSPHAQSSTTFSSVSDPAGGEGIALAVPADSPCDCEFSYDETFRHAVRFRFGLSPAAGGQLKSRAAFSLAVYRCDGRWGLRDAARRFHFFALDVMGVEGHGRMEQKRVMACQKPFLLLIYNIHDDPARMEHFYHLATFYGIYPSFANMRVYETPQMYAPVAALNNRFVPVLRAITAAGWEPITLARSSRDDVWLERWGPGSQGEVYLTVYNASGHERRATLTIQTAELGLKGSVLRAADQLSDATCEAAISGGGASVELSLPAEQVRALRLKSE